MTGQPGWTIAEACAQFAAQGMPVEPGKFGTIVRTLQIPRLGETRSGHKGGRGYTLYPVGELQRLHAALAPWLTAGNPDGRVARPVG